MRIVKVKLNDIKCGSTKIGSICFLRIQVVLIFSFNRIESLNRMNELSVAYIYVL